jgi:sensor c-di-GMP phosphodiesterase-like protein
MMECSSVGGPPVPLGKVAFRTGDGITVYDAVPLLPHGRSPLLGLMRDDVVVLVHRGLPLDIWTAGPSVGLAVVQLEQGEVLMARGNIDRAWAARLGRRAELTFIDGGRLVAIVHSPRYPRIAAISAVPAALLDQRIAYSTRRLLPAGAVCGLALGTAVLLLARRQMSMAAALRAALRRNEFFLVCQPIVDLRSGAWTGVEALLRWRRSSTELVGPDLFIPIAEQSGLITRLTERVLELVESDAGHFLAAHPGFHVGVNLSPADLRSPAVAERIDVLLARSGAHPSNLMVEITERGFLDLASACGTIRALRTRGIGVAIDDFGTGYSSLSYLETLDLDVLKIDRSFIEAIGTGAPTSQVVGHIIAMARTLGLTMIAEGIESDAQHEFLLANGVEYGQGWLFGAPMPFADLVRAMRSREAHTPLARDILPR